MFSDLFYQLVEQGVLVRGIWETVYMTLLSTVIAYGIGLPLGILLNVTGKSGLHPVRKLRRKPRCIRKWSRRRCRRASWIRC